VKEARLLFEGFCVFKRMAFCCFSLPY